MSPRRVERLRIIHTAVISPARLPRARKISTSFALAKRQPALLIVKNNEMFSLPNTLNPFAAPTWRGKIAA